MKKGRFKLIIFDFDGTLADTFDLCADTINQILKDRGQETATEREKQEARNLPAKEIFKYFGISPYQFPFVVRKILQSIGKNFDKVELFIGVKKLLNDLKKEKKELIILTSNTEENVGGFLKRKKIRKYFSEVYYKSGAFSKHLTVNRIIKKRKLNKNEILMIGDEVRDIEAAKKSKVKVACVTWGYNSEKILRKYKPEFIVNKPAELLEIIK